MSRSVDRVYTFHEQIEVILCGDHNSRERMLDRPLPILLLMFRS